MNTVNFYAYGHSDATEHAIEIMKQSGYKFLPCPSKEVTHLLLPTPSFHTDMSVKGGGDLGLILSRLPSSVTIIGGNLNHPLLESFHKIDLLKDAQYLATNAAITAHCAIKVALNHSKSILTDKQVLVIGWGRIGKCLAGILQNMGCDVAIATRKPEDRAILHAMGFKTENSANICRNKYNLIFNTSPEPVLTIDSNDVIAIELASTSGLLGDNIITARGLPSKDAPESSGKLIAQSIHRLIEKDVIS